MKSSKPPVFLRFSTFELDLRAGELRRHGRRTGVPEQSVTLLAMLLERPGEVVLREEIRKRLWPNDTVVEFDHSINAAMGRLRVALGDSAENPEYVETLPRRGYRWIGPSLLPEIEERIERDQAAPHEPNPVAGNLIGKRVSHYRVLEVIGGGGMGIVYKAEDLKLGRRVALKFLPEELVGDPAALQRFRSEARSASALNHPNICTIYGVEEYDGQPFLIMELLEGHTLRDLISASAPLQVTRLLNFALQITGALEAAHTQGIIHRDIKPANIFITSHDQAKILDFGLAKLFLSQDDQAVFSSNSQGRNESASGAKHEDEPLTVSSPFLSRTGVAMGTAGYMSPEQVRGEKLDARTDLFSFGLVLYEMATGKRAFLGETAPTLHDAILNRSQSPARDLNPKVPRKLEQIVSRALEKDREIRYQSAPDLRSDLEIAKSEIEQKRFVGRQIAVAGVIAVAALLIVGIVSRNTRGSSSSSGVAPDLKFRPLTINVVDNRVLSGAISPDGKYLAYSDVNGLRLKLIANDQIQIIPQPEEFKKKKVFWEVVAWFPDTTRFITNSHSTVPGDSGWTTSSDANLWIVSLLGGPPQKLRDNAVAYAVSPDGSLISFGTNPWKLGEREIWVMGPDGEQSRKLFSAETNDAIGGLSWSPDAKRFLYIHTDASGDSFMSADLDGSQVLTIIPPSGMKDLTDFSLLPDGRLIYALKELNDNGVTCNYWIRKVNLSTGQVIAAPERLTNWSGFCIDRTTVTSDGKRLSFLSWSLKGTGYMADLDPDGTRVLNPRNFDLEETDDAITDWTADGKAVLVSSNRSDHYRIGKRSLDSQTPTEVLTSGSGGLLVSALYTPDGQWILAQLWPLPGGPLTPEPLLRIASTGGASTLLFQLTPGGAAACAEPPSSVCVVAEPSDDGKKMIVRALDPVKGRGPALASFAVDAEPDGQNPARWSISPDGTRLATSPGPAGPMRIISLRGEPDRIVPVRDLNLGPLWWTPDGSGLLLTNFAAGGTVLLHLDLLGNTKLLWNCGQAQMCFGVPSHDGRHLAIYERKNSSNIWMIENF